MSERRLLVIKIIIVAMMLAIIWRLYDMQIINGEGYKNLSEQRITANITMEAPRGEITDRNGKVLVSNRKGYTIKLQKTDISDEKLNVMLLKLFDIFGADFEFADTLPITKDEPFEYTFSSIWEKTKWFSGEKNIDASMTCEQLLSYYKKQFGIDRSFSPKASRELIGIRYEIRKSGFKSEAKRS